MPESLFFHQSYLNKMLFVVLLAAAAVGGNVLHLSLFFGVDLLFGSIAALLALVWLGRFSGIVVAAAGGAYTLVLWDHPYALLILVAEIIVVGAQREWARRRGRPLPPLALADALYWLLIGIPLVLLCYRFGLEMNWSQTLLVVFKQSLNGIFNAAIVGLILLLVALVRRPQGGIRIAELHFSSLLLATLLPGLLIASWGSQRYGVEMEKRLGERLQAFAQLTLQELNQEQYATDTHPEQRAAKIDTLIRIFNVSLLQEADLQMYITTANAPPPFPIDSVMRLHRTQSSLQSRFDSRMERYRSGRYDLAVPCPKTGGALVMSVNAASLVDRVQIDVRQTLVLLMVLTLLALLIAQIGSRHLAILLQRLVTSARALPIAIRDQISWIAPPPSFFLETNQLAETLDIIGKALTTNFRLLNVERTNFRAFFESMDDLIFVTTLDGQILDVNPAVENKLGYSVKELIGTSIMSIHPVDSFQTSDDELTALRNGLTNTCSLPLLTKNGEQIPATARIWRGHWNGLECFFGITKDQTAELAARTALSRERDLFSAGPVFTITWDLGEYWPVRQVSNNVTDILGYTPAEMLAANFRYADLIHPDDFKQVNDEFNWYLKYRRDTFEQSYRLRLYSGEYRWFYDFTRLMRDARGQLTEIRGYLFDQSHLKEAQLALIRERQRLMNVIDGTHLGTWEWNIATGTVVVNAYWANICGYTVAELEPISYATWQRLVHPNEFANCEKELRTHLADANHRYSCELRMRHKDGYWVWVLTEGSVVIRDAQNQPQIMAGTHTDISERKYAEIQLRRRELLDHLLVELAGELVNLTPVLGLDVVIERALARFGHHLDRTFFCKIDYSTNTLSKTHEWTAAGVAPLREQCQCLAVDTFANLIKSLRRNQSIILPQLADLNVHWRKEYALLFAPNTQSLLLMPVIDGSRLIGFLGLDAVQLPHRFTKNKIEFMRVYANLLASIFQREQSYESLRDSVVRYDLLTQQTRSIAWEVNAEGLFTYVSPLSESILGYRAEELIGKQHFYDLAPAAEREALKTQAFEVFARHGLFQDFVNVAQHRNGQRIWLLTHAQPFFDAQGKLRGYRGTDQDITARQETLARLAASEQRFRVVFDHAPLGIAIPDAKRCFIYVNHAYAKLLGRDRDALLGQCIDSMIYPEDRDEIQTLFAELMSGTRTGYQVNRRYLRPDGEVRWGEVRVTLIPGLDGEMPLPVAMVEDITERLAAQEHNQRLQFDLDAARERATIGHLASGIAHDFNNLLGVIDANLIYLGDVLNRPADPEIAEVLEETQSALGHAKVITAGMLSLSRAGGIHCERVDLRLVFDELIGILRHLLPRSIKAQFDVAAELTAISNAAFLQAALLNLALNARDAMPDGGQLQLTATLQPNAPELPPRLGIMPVGAHVEICVSDTGHGMRPETLERIFEPLFSTKAKQRGHGLGLFMVQEFVIRSGAALTVDSRLGEGTAFRLLLSGTAESDDARDVLPSSAGQRVLLVEDDARVREAIGRLLLTQGLQFSAAEHGADALKILQTDAHFDVVLSDIAMPILDGFSLFEAIARDYPQLPVILMSGQDLQPECHVNCQHNHAYCPAVLRKPLDIEQLMRTIALVCQDPVPRCQPICLLKSATNFTHYNE